MGRITKRRMSEREIEMEYQRAATLVEQWDDGTNHPRLAPLDKCTPGEEALFVPVLGINTLKLRHRNQELEGAFPGAELYVENQASGVARFVLELPIWTEVRDEWGGDEGGGSPRRRRARLGLPAGPRTELLYFLLASTASLSVTLYYQLAA